MLEQLPQDVQDGLARAQKRSGARARRLNVQLGDAVFPILRLWDNGFAIDADRLPHLRGFVDIHEGPRLLMSCLIVAAQVEDGELVCTFKRATLAADRPAADYELGIDQPVALLPRN